MPQLQALIPRLATTLMDIQSTAMPPTLPEQPWSHAGIQRTPLLTWCPSLPTTPQGTLLEVVTWIMLMVTPLHLVMVMSWFPPITMHPTTTKEASKATSVDILHNNWSISFSDDLDFRIISILASKENKLMTY